ncbi:MAG: protoporphyrinogen oxidase [Alphaproteobacteria bacterium]|nr:protoporphyrinogen oxidase [Alphaproteobacteria bacterium]
MNVLIAFGTTEGQTRKIARHLSETIDGLGHSATLFDSGGDAAGAAVASFDAVILAASVHHERYQTAFYEFVKDNREALQAKPRAFISVSLSQTLAGGEPEAQRYVDGFVAETGLSFDQVHLAEGAIRYFEYSRSEADTIELIVFKGQKKMPKAGGNPEYTDWEALDAFAKKFLTDVARSIPL